MLCELTRLIDNAEVDRQNRTVEPDPHLTNSQSGFYNNTVNMINSQVVHGLSVNLSGVGEANTSGIEDDKAPFFADDAHGSKQFSFYKQALLGLKTNWENQRTAAKPGNHSILNDTLEKELEAGDRKDPNMNVSNDFLLFVNEGQESREESSKIFETNENNDAFGKDDIKNISIIKEC
jgi:hypothetical protein